MIKKFGITIGGLQQKIFNLVLIVILAMVGVFGAVSAYQAKRLASTVGETRSEQEQSIENISGGVMHQVIDQSMTKTNALQAYIADDMFLDIKTDVSTLEDLLTGLFASKDLFEPYPAYAPDRANDGKYTAQVLCEEGVDWKNSEYLGVAARAGDMMVAMCERSGYLDNCFVGLADGTALCVDAHSANKFDENGNVPSFATRQRPWYTGAAEAGGITFSDPEYDTYTGRVCIECSAPIYADGKLAGVVGADLFLDSMEAYVKRSSGEGGFIAVVNNEGQVVFAPEGNGILTVKMSGTGDDLRKSDNKQLADFIGSALSEQTAVTSVTIDGKDYYMVGSPISTVGWTVISFVEKSVTDQPTVMMMDEYDKINARATAKFEEGTSRSKQTTLVMIVLILVLGSASALILAGRIVKPVERMTARIGGISGSDLAFTMEDSYKTGDEIEVLAESFAELSKRTLEYIEKITKITAEKERIGAELELATRIQADMLPNIFPAFPERPEFDIYASMTPAKEVGGDFYDFFLIDDDHLGMVMADVSGKGVPAALFMMMSKILVGNYAMMGGSPAKVLEQVNTQICKNNDEEMFVTVWFGIMEISTGKVTAANAGHEYPIMRKADGDFEILKDKHGIVVGGMDSIHYKEYDFTLERGGTLFLYTDGVAEATDANNRLFGTERMVEALNREPNASPKTLLRNMKEAVDEFVGEAPQFDDLTMLCVKLL